MKVLKLYEKKIEDLYDQYCWLVVYLEEGDSSNYLYPDEESAKNCCIHLINTDRRQMLGHNYNDSSVFIDFHEAMFWYEKNVNITITLQKIPLRKPYDGSPDMIRVRDMKKYNL
jgi:hypothetical protein